MTTISERLRHDAPNMPHDETEVLLTEAADTIDALVAALEGLKNDVLAADFNEHWDSYKAIDAALAKAKSCHTGNSARGNAMKDDA